jgi:hypothetical protein
MENAMERKKPASDGDAVHPSSHFPLGGRSVWVYHVFVVISSSPIVVVAHPHSEGIYGRCWIFLFSVDTKAGLSEDSIDSVTHDVTCIFAITCIFLIPYLLITKSHNVYFDDLSSILAITTRLPQHPSILVDNDER